MLAFIIGIGADDYIRFASLLLGKGRCFEKQNQAGANGPGYSSLKHGPDFAGVKLHRQRAT
jgi:hypothetical protein